MKKFKFKGQIKLSGDKYDVESIIFGGSNSRDIIKLKKPYGNNEFMEDEVNLLPYIGLDDKNGIDIYQGDKVKINKNSDSEGMYSMEDEIGVVSFYNGSPILRVSKEDRAYFRSFMDIVEFIGMDKVEVIKS